MNKNLSILMSILFVTAASAKGIKTDTGTNKSNAGAELKMDFKPEVVPGLFATDEQYDAQLKIAKKVGSQRFPSSSTVSDDKGMSPQYAAIRDRINKLGFDEKGQPLAKDKMYLAAEDFDKLLVELDEKMSTYPDDLKFFAAHLVPMRQFKSFVWRMSDVVAPYRIIRQTLVDQIQDAYADMKLFFPRTEWEVGFAYLTEPLSGTGPMFKSEQEVEVHIAKFVLPAIQHSITVLDSIKVDAAKPLIFDNRTLYGRLAFPGDLNRFYVIRQPEVMAATARMHRQAYKISLGLVYNAQNTMKLAGEVGAAYGLEVAHSTVASKIPGLTNDDVAVGAPSRLARVKILKYPTFKNSFLKNTNGDAYAQLAWSHLKAFVRDSEAAWTMLNNSPDYDSAFLDPAFFKARVPETREMFANMKSLVSESPAVVKSVISDKAVRVNLKSFFMSMPDDSKVLAPTAFEGGSQWNKRTVDGKEVSYRNYGMGRATGWDSSIYKTLFPDLANLSKDKADVAVNEQLRNWTESRGGAVMSDFIQPFVH